MRLGTSTNYRNNLNSSQTNLLTNTYSSSINSTFSNRNLIGVPTTFTVNLRHSQNTQSRMVNLTLPQISIQMNRVYPFKSKKVGAKSSIKKAVEGIGLSNIGNFEMRGSFHESDIRLNSLGSLIDDFNYGYKHQFNASTSIKAGVVSINPSLSFSSNIYTKVKELTFDPESLIAREDTVSDFSATYKWSTGVNASTKFFGTFIFRNAKKIKALRHTVTPQVGFNYAPVTGRRVFGFVGENGEDVVYDPAEIGIFGSASNYNRRGALQFSLQNNLEMKVSDGKGGTKKVAILDRLTLSTSRNLAADSLKWSDLTLSAATRVGSNFNINFNSRYSFYGQDNEGSEIDRFLIDENKFLLRTMNMGGGINLDLSGDDFKRKITNPSSLEEKDENLEEPEDEYLEELERDDFEAANFDVPWNASLRYSLNRVGGWSETLLKDTFNLRQSLTLNGSVSLGANWRFTVQTGVDLVSSPELTPTRLTIYRSLHCWELTADYIPFGEFKSYTITLNVRSSTLRDLRINRTGRFKNQNNLRG